MPAKSENIDSTPLSATNHDSVHVPLTFEQVYDEHFAFVWRLARRLGAACASDDISQQVFIIVLRQLPHFEYRSSIKTWLFTITRRVVRDYFRANKRAPFSPEPIAENVADMQSPDPAAHAAKAEAARRLHRILAQLDDDKREVFVLAELEEMSVVQIAEALGINQNTLYSRLREARREFERAVERECSRETRGAK